MNNRQLTINGLTACGWTRDGKTAKYVVFTRPETDQQLFVGKSGALRWSVKGTVKDSISMTNGPRHRAYREIGNPSIKWESTDQANNAYRYLIGN